MIEHRTGDLFAQDLPALAHGVNCRGVMGAGIAVPFKRQFPDMYLSYRDLCEIFSDSLLGDILPWSVSGYWVYNLFTQDLPGPHADLDAVTKAVHRMLAHAEGYGVKAIGLPRIGCGIGGLKWDDVEAVLHEASESYPLTNLVVVSLE